MYCAQYIEPFANSLQKSSMAPTSGSADLNIQPENSQEFQKAEINNFVKLIESEVENKQNNFASLYRSTKKKFPPYSTATRGK